MSRVDEIRKRLDVLRGAKLAGAACEDISYLLGRVEKLEGLLKRLVAAQHASCLEQQARNVASEARTLLADEENAQ